MEVVFEAVCNLQSQCYEGADMLHRLGWPPLAGVVVGNCYRHPNQKEELNHTSLRRARWRVQETAGCPVSPQSFGRLWSKLKQIPWKAISHHMKGMFGDNQYGFTNGKSCLTNLLVFCKKKVVNVIHLSLGRLSTQSNIASLYGQR